MTDLNSLGDMLNRAKIEYTEKEEKVKEDWVTFIVVEEGYSGFFSQFEFDMHGKLLDMGAYE